jgi:hypothetical protein
MLVTIAVSEIPYTPGEMCKGPRNNRVAANLNNVSFETPRTAILGAYYRLVLGGVAKVDFPDNPAVEFNYTSEDLPLDLRFTARDTRVKVLEYGAVVEVVFPGHGHPWHREPPHAPARVQLLRGGERGRELRQAQGPGHVQSGRPAVPEHRLRAQGWLGRYSFPGGKS